MDLFEAVFNHLALPPRLPGKPDDDTTGIERNILTRLIRACDTLDKLTGQERAETWAPVRKSLCICLKHSQGRLEKETLLQEFRSLQPEVPLILHVVEQNAALIIRRVKSCELDDVIFEAFEASPSSEAVLATENALQWDFPGRSSAVPFDEFTKASFQDSLAVFLEQASMESVKRFAARSDKAKVSVIEARDTADPAIVTQLLMPLLEAIGHPIDAPKIRKRVRDDVNIETAEFPWRRLPFWLILRVATQRQLCLALGSVIGRACYKFLICAVLAQLLEESTGQLAPELSTMLKAKLCRRLAKLELDKNKALDASVAYEQLFRTVGPWLTAIIEENTKQVDLSWANFRKTILRPVPRLPMHADESSLRLSLPHSGGYLQGILQLPRTERSFNSALYEIPLNDDGMASFEKLIDRYSTLSRLENKIQRKSSMAPENPLLDCYGRCVKIAASIELLFLAVGCAYDSNPEQMSIFILNLFDLWIQMDKCAVEACALLLDYHPIFKPELLDVLQLPTLSDMLRLRDIQSYLRARCKNCRFAEKTIFNISDKACFAVRYLEQSANHRKLQGQIEIASFSSRTRKELEWNAACKKYDDLSQQISDSTCVCSFNPDGSRNVNGCKKCWQWRTRKRLKITAHEDFLPDDVVQKAVIVFELDVPEYLAAYRNATWMILSKLGHPSRPSSSSSHISLLKDYSQLQPFNSSKMDGISLASPKKSFLKTHYKAYPMKISLSSILFPFGMQFSYYDLDNKLWVNDLDKTLTFQHLCGVHIPHSLQASVIPPVLHPEPSDDGPSSYEIVASQTKCPSEISIHEFLSYQRLLSGKNRRWLTMLVEMGSSNVNFSTEDTMHLFNQLAVQAGPAQNETGPRRDIHVVFQDPLFCDRLVEQIENRLRNILSNWRETHCMEVLITLSLRLFSLASGVHQQSAERLLQAARNATLQWLTCLRNEVRNAVEADVAERAARYGFWAALLCRRTFTIFAKSDSKINAEDLGSFILASVALQENLVVDLERLPQHLKNLLVRDIKMCHNIQPLVYESIKSNPESIGGAILKSWADSSGSVSGTFSSWQFLDFPYQTWVMSTITTRTEQFDFRQVVHYNYVQGQILLDGKPLRKLPENIRNSDVVKELFGNQHLLTYPSSLHGMSHKLATNKDKHEVHFGLRGEKVVIRAITNRVILEHVPRDVFVGNDNCDLPSALVENCVHWLNLSSGCLEIRRKPAIWRTRPRDWNLDVPNRRARRWNSYLVDPHSNLCEHIARIFRHFEDPKRLTIFQPTKGKLSVELRHLELSFFVNRKGLLECRELKAEVDPDQDAGTLYGLDSAIVLRDLDDNERRSIITPLGPLFYRRRGMHVAVRAQPTSDYGKFEIDRILGRLSCPPEPRLLFAKAQFHAFTSFVLPDPLTGRLGTEEAVHTLNSGHSQPWAPLGKSPILFLENIRNLSPDRKYYPPEKRRLQTTTWDDCLTTTIQHDSYEPIIQAILLKSDRLQAFNLNNENGGNLDRETLSHLRRRGEVRRLLYERWGPDSGRLEKMTVVTYQSRDREASLPEAANVYQVAKLIRREPVHIYMNKKLQKTLRKWKYIGGFDKTSETIPPSLSNLGEDTLAEQWGSLVNLSRGTDIREPYQLMFRLAGLSFSPNAEMDIIRSLVAFACLSELKDIQPPQYSSFDDFEVRAPPSIELIQSHLSASYVAFKPTSKKKTRLAMEQQYRMNCQLERNRLAPLIVKQWPNSELSMEGLESNMVDIGVAFEQLVPMWNRSIRNLELSEYVGKVQEVLDRHKDTKDLSKPWLSNAGDVMSWPSHLGSAIPSLSREVAIESELPDLDSLTLDLSTTKRDDYATNEDSSSLIAPKMIAQANQRSQQIDELHKILASFTQTPDNLRQEYGNDLKKSLAALRTVKETMPQQPPPGPKIIQDLIEKTQVDLRLQFRSNCNALSVKDCRFRWLQMANLWPCLTPVSILELLRLDSGHQIHKSTIDRLISYGLLITKLQRLHRIKTAQLKANSRQILENWRNVGHENWSPFGLTSWLLLEIDGNILIRPEQVEVARAIISPASASNSVLQMNMGKGKTSCIVPMAVAVLGGKNQLSRLIVPKALLLQTAQTIQARLGGLVGREVRHIPFSRRTPTTADMLQLYSELHEEVLRCRGVVLTTPEHVLSYKLSGLQRLADSKLLEARKMIKFQSRLSEICRDVLDESDFTLAVKTQLIYPSGPRLPMDGHPQRWKVAQMLLSLVEDQLTGLERDFAQGIEIFRPPQGFPFMHFLQKTVEDSLHHRIVDDICDGRTSFLRLSDSARDMRGPEIKVKIKRVLSEERLDSELLQQVLPFFADPDVAFKNILLVRGLLLNRILLMCLKKRWNVQYGLHPKRVPLAVPFEAKGVPSEYAEFGHPDVAIIFTCLAFYYSGLTLSQFREGLQQILNSDDPASDYDTWIVDANALPEALHYWNVINPDDEGQLTELWQHLRLSRSVLNHYMNHFVFPVHAKQFGIKLQASGWDLPLFAQASPGRKVSSARTTGFSGTNDNKMMLPLTIKQDDLPSLSQTNAEVLTYLLERRNRRYHVAATQGERLTAETLLSKIAKMGIRVLIDAGAHILQMDNRSVVKAWLDIDTIMPGAVYFGADNRAWVQYRGDKQSVPLLATPFAENLDRCLVYIDEAHTRGVNLKLPQAACGALTLALGQTKDHTVQAAMRLRQLGSTQSVVFFAPPEVHQSILDVCKKKVHDEIDSSHVVTWLLEQTCRSNEQLQNLYLAQGTNFCHRLDAQLKNKEFLDNSSHREAYLKVVQQPERQTLEQMYGNQHKEQPSSPRRPFSTELEVFMEKLTEQRRTAKASGNCAFSSVLEEVEQERQVEIQVEEVREVQAPIHYDALVFPKLHSAIQHFAKTGYLSGESGYEHVFEALSRTNVGQKHKVSRTGSRLFASCEFMRTIKTRKLIRRQSASDDRKTFYDDYMRPVEWILWCPSTETALIVISEEAELLIPVIRGKKQAMVHLITYAAPVTKNMLHFNALSYYVLPPLPPGIVAPKWLSIELGIFSGRLYIDFDDCAPLKQYLMLAESAAAGAPQNGSEQTRGFATDPMSFLLEWLSLRRKGQDITHTPMGFICHGRPLLESHTFFVRPSRDVEKSVAPFTGSKGTSGRFEGHPDDEDADEDADEDLEGEWPLMDQ